MVNTSPRVAEPGVMSHARMTGTNLSMRMRVSATEPSSRSVNSRWSVLSLWVSPLTTSTRPALERTTPEIAPAARARARCQWDKARAGGRSDCCDAPRSVSSDGQSPLSCPTSSANCSGSILPRKKPSARQGLGLGFAKPHLQQQIAHGLDAIVCLAHPASEDHRLPELRLPRTVDPQIGVVARQPADQFLVQHIGRNDENQPPA